MLNFNCQALLTSLKDYLRNDINLLDLECLRL